MTRLLGISGALRRGSTNTRLVKEAARLFAPDRFEIADLRLPLYDADLEAEGMPPEVTRLVEQIRAADAIVISTPEYNKAPPGVLKNALDWVSRVQPMATIGKPLAVISAANGIAGGQRSTSALYLMLIPFKVRFVFDPEVTVGRSTEKFDADGRLTDEAALKFLRQKMEALRAAVVQ